MGKKIAIDTYYYEDSAKTVGVIFNNWDDPEPERGIVSWSYEFGPYIPGKFYIRELPCIMGLLKKIPDILFYDAIILDGLARLPGSTTEGLGMHLEEELGNVLPGWRGPSPTNPEQILGPGIIGVAKTKFSGCDEDGSIAKVFRGSAIKPLYVNTTWFNVSAAEAAKAIKSMHGSYRLPTLLKILDKETKIKGG